MGLIETFYELILLKCIIITSDAQADAPFRLPRKSFYNN